MDFRHFERMNHAEALNYLMRYLEVESAAMRTMSKAIVSIDLNFQFESITPLFKWVSIRISTVPIAPDPHLPAWIREAPDYEAGLYEFDDASRRVGLRLSY